MFNYSEEKIEKVIERQKEKNKKMLERYNDPKYKKFIKAKGIMRLCIKILLLLCIFGFAIIVTRNIIDIYNQAIYDTRYDIIEQLESRYGGKFSIISQDNNVYKISDNKGFEFTAVKEGFSFDGEYDAYLLKQYTTKYIEKNNITNISCIDITRRSKYQNTEINDVRIEVNIPNYFEFEKSLEALYNLDKYLLQNLTKDIKNGNLYWNFYINLNDFKMQISSNYMKIPLNDYIFKGKNEYINYLHTEKIEDKNVPVEDYNSFYYPNELKIYINGKQIRHNSMIKTAKTVEFDIERKEYKVTMYEIAESIPTLDEVNISSQNTITSIVYNGKTYYLDYSLDNVKKDKIPSIWTMSMLEEFFNVDISYDFDKQEIYLDFKE